jgi:hypothetical protein
VLKPTEDFIACFYIVFAFSSDCVKNFHPKYAIKSASVLHFGKFIKNRLQNLGFYKVQLILKNVMQLLFIAYLFPALCLSSLHGKIITTNSKL